MNESDPVSPGKDGSDRVLVTDLEGTVGELSSEYQNGWAHIHDEYAVPDWPLYQKYIDEDGDLLHGRHAAEDTLLIRRATGDDPVQLGREVESSRVDITQEWFEPEAIQEAQDSYTNHERSDRKLFESIAEEMNDKWEFFDGAKEFLKSANNLGYQIHVVSALPHTVAQSIIDTTSTPSQAYPWKTIDFDDTGDFRKVGVSHSEGKHQIVREFQDAGVSVAFLGDGSNDLGALRAAQTSIYFGEPEGLPPHTTTYETLDSREDDKPTQQTFEEAVKLLEQASTDQLDNTNYEN